MLLNTNTILPPLLLASAVASYPYLHPHSRRSFIAPNDVKDSYDFVIIGGGLAGLVLASRLSENSATNILVLEAGGNGDNIRERIDTPGLAYYKNILSEPGVDWMYQTQPQDMLNYRQVAWPSGKVVGGSSAANGMYLVRPSSIEVDVWHELIKNLNGSDAWTSDSFFAAMRKSETFTPPRDDIRDLAHITFNQTAHGTTGPLHSTHSAYMPPMYGSWIDTLSGQGVTPAPNPYNGEAWGAYISTLAINPTNWTRSYSRSAYIDPYYRPNLHILTNAPVSKVVLDGTTVVGAQYGTDLKTVKATKEVILSAGAIGSPAILLRSGIGPKDILDAAAITTLVNLPGVGQNLQDHLASGVTYKVNGETAAVVYNNASDPRSKTPEFLSYVNSAIAYVNTANLVSDPTLLGNQIMANLSTFANTLVPSHDEGVLNGYKATYTQYGTTLLRSNVGQVELLFSTTGTSSGADTIQIQVALQRPFSHGHLWINSTDSFAPPIIDPAYLSHPADMAFLREGLKMARRISATAPLSSFIVEELKPGLNITSDNDIETWLRGDAHTEFHPSCTCSMLPQNLGGVVDANLRVYGVSNLRVVDGSVFPIEWAAHLMAPIYGLAEKAAEIIAADYNAPLGLNPSNGSGDGNSTGSGDGNGNGNSNSKSNGTSAKVTICPVHLVFVVLFCAIMTTL